MPVISGGGGAGGPAAGTYDPVGSASGVTLDTTTYDDPVRGAGAKLRTLVFATEGVAFAVAQAGNAFPQYFFTSDGTDQMFYLGDGTADPYTLGNGVSVTNGGTSMHVSTKGNLFLEATQQIRLNGTQGTIGGSLAATPQGIPMLNQLSPLFTVTSGALATVQLVTATGAQISTTRDAETITPCTFNPGAATTATVTVALSPDNVTYSTLGVETEPAGVAFDGTIHLIKVRVPAGWYIKLTVNAQAVLGLTTYY